MLSEQQSILVTRHTKQQKVRRGTPYLHYFEPKHNPKVPGAAEKQPAGPEGLSTRPFRSNANHVIRRVHAGKTARTVHFGRTSAKKRPKKSLKTMGYSGLWKK
jgi:hypothetical protein